MTNQPLTSSLSLVKDEERKQAIWEITENLREMAVGYCFCRECWKGGLQQLILVMIDEIEGIEK